MHDTLAVLACACVSGFWVSGVRADELRLHSAVSSMSEQCG